VRPYYLYQCDLSEGIGHFRTPVSVGIGIIEALRGHTSGYAIPTFVVDAPGGGGKIPVMPQYLISQSDSHVVLRNYEGVITAYPEPQTYARHDPATCPECQAARPAEGVHRLLVGQGMVLEPEGLSRARRRPLVQHPDYSGATPPPLPPVEAGQETIPSWEILDSVKEWL
jgi:lysine 2,3-aminomutase